GTDPSGDRFEFLNTELRKDKVDIIDEHYYRTPEWFLQNAARYDKYDRNGPKIFAGEYAAQSDKVVSIHNKNNLRTALAEAAFMTGLERNAGVVAMASYAPLFAHAEGWQWTPDMIWVDNLRSYGTPNYYVQKLYSTNRGTHVVSALQNDLPLTGQDSMYASAVIDKGTGELIIKMVNAGNLAAIKDIQINGAKKLGASGTQTLLTANDTNAMNSLDAPALISPVTSALKPKGNLLRVELPPHSFTVVKIRI
ncbi:MAG: alpha-L-arabinofuranosidase, partial [Pedobacter sp.]